MKDKRIACIYGQIMCFIHFVEDEDFAFPSDTFVSMKRGILPVGKIYDWQYGINWIPTPSSYINQISSNIDKMNSFPISLPTGKMNKNNPLRGETNFLTPGKDHTVPHIFKENGVRMY